MKARPIASKLWAAGGFASFCLGTLGALVPFIPTTPFVLVAAFCFARSSERVNAWFVSTRLYRAVFEGYATKRAMTVRSKLLLLVPLTAVLGVSFACMDAVPLARAAIALVWIVHVGYFGFVVKTDRPAVAEGRTDPAR